jgi:hypothetical protein
MSSFQYGTESVYFFYSNIEARSCNHCCSGKAISSTYYGCTLGIQPVLRMRHVVIRWLHRSTVFFHTAFEKKLLNRKCVF